MNNTLFTNSAEVKSLLGITSTTDDHRISMFLPVVTNSFNRILRVSEICSHSVLKERVKNYCEYILVKDFPVSMTGIKIYDSLFREITGYTPYTDPHQIREIRWKDSAGNPTRLIYDEVFVDYTAGYTTKDTIKLTDNPTNLETVIIDVLGVPTTYVFKDTPTLATDVQRGATVNDSASNLATKIGGTASTDTVTAPFGYSITGGTADATITPKTLPNDFILAVALACGGAIEDTNRATNADVQSYTIGGKTVNYGSGGSIETLNFRNNREAIIFDGIVRNWTSFFRKFNFC